jgi:Thioredoxin
VATALKEKGINVGRVDVTANRDLGTRFDIKGFPTVKLLSKGKVYLFKGRRSFEELVDFATGGFQIHEPEDVPEELGWFGEVKLVYRHAYKEATKDLLAKRYFTMNVFLVALPVIFLVIMVIMCMLPIPSPEDHPQRRRQLAQKRTAAETPAYQQVPSAPPTSASDTKGKSD